MAIIQPILFIVLTLVCGSWGSNIGIISTTIPGYGCKYQAYIFYTGEELDSFLEHTELNDATLVNVKTGATCKIHQKPMFKEKIVQELDRYKITYEQIGTIPGEQ